MKITTTIAFVLTIIGALVWLLVGLANINLVGLIFGLGAGAIVSRIIYILVGLAGLWLIFYLAVYRPLKNL
jgi:uncharacterized membrane protein YuzA (DUF378 family)